MMTMPPPRPPQGQDDERVEGHRVDQPGDRVHAEGFEDGVEDPGVAVEDELPHDGRRDDRHD
jgi:hypothetical protein